MLLAHARRSLQRLSAGSPDSDARPALPADPGGVGLATRFEPVINVTLGWILMYYGFLFRQSETTFKVVARVKKPFNSVKYGGSGGREVLEAARTAGNMLEQAPLFLSALWMNAAFVSPTGYGGTSPCGVLNWPLVGLLLLWVFWSLRCVPVRWWWCPYYPGTTAAGPLPSSPTTFHSRRGFAQSSCCRCCWLALNQSSLAPLSRRPPPRSSYSAARSGWLWLAARAIYPAVFGKFPHIFLSTFPGYILIGRLCWPLAPHGQHLRAPESTAVHAEAEAPAAATAAAAAAMVVGTAPAQSPVASPPACPPGVALALDSPGTIVLSD